MREQLHTRAGRLLWLLLAALWLAVALLLVSRAPRTAATPPASRVNPHAPQSPSRDEATGAARPARAPASSPEPGIRPPWRLNWIPELRREPDRPRPRANG